MGQSSALTNLLSEARKAKSGQYRVYEEFKRRLKQIIKDPTQYDLALRELAKILKV